MATPIYSDMPHELIEVDLNALIGEVISGVSGLAKFSECLHIFTCSGKEFVMYHNQQCCEDVWLEDVDGNESDLIGGLVVAASEYTNSDESAPPAANREPESYTWTFYTISTTKGTVTIRWYGESNGYYSESATLAYVKYDKSARS